MGAFLKTLTPGGWLANLPGMFMGPMLLQTFPMFPYLSDHCMLWSILWKGLLGFRWKLQLLDCLNIEEASSSNLLFFGLDLPVVSDSSGDCTDGGA